MDFKNLQPDTFLNFSALQLDELIRHLDMLVCNADYMLPDGPIGQQMLSDFDCGQIRADATQVSSKWESCAASARTIQGASEETCNALFVQLGHLMDTTNNVVNWYGPVEPENPTPDELRILAPNLEGEFKARLNAFEFGLGWFFKSIPEGGTGP